MSTEQELVIYPDAELVAAATGARFITTIVDAQARGGTAHVCLTGGRGGTSALAAILADPAAGALDWSRIEFWWSDERFLPEGDPQRNETGARAALLDHVPVPPEHIHPMPRLGGPAGEDVDQAAADYAAQLLAAAPPGQLVPEFDVIMLGVGEDGHIASLFPHRDEKSEPASCVSVRDSPKPPPVRTTFTLKSILAGREIWLIGFGDGKADAIKKTLAGNDADEAPASAARGSVRTLVLVDQSAASGLDRGAGGRRS